MAIQNFTTDLAKLIIVAAWADGDLGNDEINALKDLLFSLEDITEEDWNVLKMYMESPPTEAEREELVQRVLNAIQTRADKQKALETLDHLFECDGKLTREEEQLLESLRGDIEGVRTDVLAGFTRAMKSALGQRKAAVQSTVLREQDMDDYLHNTIYYDLSRKQQVAGISFDMPDERLRKLCLATGLLAHVANVDADISASEKDALRDVLAEDWDLSSQQADMLATIAVDRTTRGLDYFRLSHGFFDSTTYDERKEFLHTLFRIANAAEKTSVEEIEEIRSIAGSLKLSHKDYIDAKLSIPRADRGGF